MLAVLTTSVMQSCLAPVFSDLQSARLVGDKNLEVTPSYTTMAYPRDKETGEAGSQSHLGLQAAYGLSEKVDLRFRFEHIWESGYGDNNEQVIALGPKFSVVKDRMALYLPFGTALSDFSTAQLQPTVLFTLPVVRDKIDFNPSAKYLLTFCEDCVDYWAFNLGMAFSNDVRKWAFRMEYGFLLTPGDEGTYRQFSCGLSLPLNKRTE